MRGIANSPWTGSQRDHAFEVFGLVFIVRYRSSEAIKLVPARTPSGSVPGGNYPVDTVWSEKTVVDSLPQAVFIDGIPEVQISVAVVFAQRCRCHAELESRLEMLKDYPPRTIAPCAAAVTLIDNDEIEEIQGVVAEEPFAPFILCERLIDREIHFAEFRGCK
jgi:hypothetical protein